MALAASGAECSRLPHGTSTPTNNGVSYRGEDMELLRGALSPDGRWVWDGTRWVAAISADARWFWNRAQWVPVSVPRQRFWQPAWRTSDTWALVVWLIAVPVVIAGTIVGLATLAPLTPVGVLVGVIAAYAVLACIGGATVRPDGRWSETLALTGALMALIVLAWIVASVVASSTQQPQPGDDDAAAIGLFLTLFVLSPPTLLAVAIGKLIRTTVARTLGAPRTP
jgi:hypothetical protein